MGIPVASFPSPTVSNLHVPSGVTSADITSFESTCFLWHLPQTAAVSTDPFQTQLYEKVSSRNPTASELSQIFGSWNGKKFRPPEREISGMEVGMRLSTHLRARRGRDVSTSEFNIHKHAAANLDVRGECILIDSLLPRHSFPVFTPFALFVEPKQFDLSPCMNPPQRRRHCPS